MLLMILITMTMSLMSEDIITLAQFISLVFASNLARGHNEAKRSVGTRTRQKINTYPVHRSKKKRNGATGCVWYTSTITASLAKPNNNRQMLVYARVVL